MAISYSPARPELRTMYPLDLAIDGARTFLPFGSAHDLGRSVVVAQRLSSRAMFGGRDV